jgi:hypothetical protein
LSTGEFTDENRSAGENENKQDQVVKHAIAHRFSKSIAGYGRHAMPCTHKRPGGRTSSILCSLNCFHGNGDV